MRYSYIKPRTKTPFTQELQLLVSFFSITLIMLFSTALFLLYKDYSFEQEKQEIIAQRNHLQKEISKMEVKIAYINKQKEFSEQLFTKNSVLRDSIANLFDLVPERITLSEATLLQNGLVLHGITPNKDIYNFMLEAPLRSIFHETYSSFYPAGNGWFHFVSTNYVNEQEEKKTDEN